MLLEVNNIYKSYKKNNGFMKNVKLEILKNVSLKLSSEECLGIIGESGSGKSTLGRLIIGVEKPDCGEIFIDGVDIIKYNNSETKRKISVVFQDYISSANPRFRVIDIVSEPIKIYEKLSKKETISRVLNLLQKVGLSSEYLYRYPHELSGGQMQRVCIARGIAVNPKLIVLDEAISSLDVPIQVQILDLLMDLKKQMGLSYLFITHDLTAITYICDRVLFFKEGAVVEEIDSINELKNIENDYSKALLKAAMTMNERKNIYEVQRIS